MGLAEKVKYAEINIPDLELPSEDGIPLETSWHRSEMNLLIELIRQWWHDRTDFYTGGNMFIYFSLEQAKNRDVRGPDFFLVKGVDGTRMRDSWIVWQEGGKYPDLIIELLSPSTEVEDKTTKKDLYEGTFHTPEYYIYSPFTEEFAGWRLVGGRYQEIKPNEQGWLWSEEMGLWIGPWKGKFLREEAVWLRFFDPAGKLVPTEAEAERERAEAEKQRAEAERQRAEAERKRAEAERKRAEAAEAELVRLRAEMDKKG